MKLTKISYIEDGVKLANIVCETKEITFFVELKETKKEQIKNELLKIIAR